jgi:hypothetical protein
MRSPSDPDRVTWPGAISWIRNAPTSSPTPAARDLPSRPEKIARPPEGPNNTPVNRGNSSFASVTWAAALVAGAESGGRRVGLNKGRATIFSDRAMICSGGIEGASVTGRRGA